MPELGPRPTARPTRPTPAQLKVLRTVIALGGHEIRHAEIAKTLGGHPNAVRPHLDALVSAGLLSVAEIRDGHRGRPPRVYHVTSSGHSALSEDASAGNGALVGALTAFMLSAGHGPDDAHRVGQIWGEALEQPSRQTAEGTDEDLSARHAVPTETHGAADNAVTRVVDVMESLGFDPHLEPATSGHTVTLKACPMLALAQQNPEFICRIHEGLIAGVMQREGTPADVNMRPFSTPTACQVHITARTTG